MKKIKYILSSAVLTVFLFGCDVQQASQDAAPVISTDSYSTATFTLSGGPLTSNEQNETVYVYDVVLDKPLQFNHDFNFVELDGTTATLHDDYDVVGGSIPSFGTTTQLMVIIHNDTEVEGTETLNLAVISGPAVADANRLNPSTQHPELNLTIEDWVFCLWTLYSSDTYGDGWNGGFVEVTSEGVSTEYATDGPLTVFDIAISEGADYSFTYVSGGGTGGGPGWESENYYKLTAPDGTEWEDGTMDYSGIPTPGLITSGTNSCP